MAILSHLENGALNIISAVVFLVSYRLWLGDVYDKLASLTNSHNSEY